MEQFKRSPLPLTESDKSFAQFLLKAVRAKQGDRHGFTGAKTILPLASGRDRPAQVKSGRE